MVIPSSPLQACEGEAERWQLGSCSSGSHSGHQAGVLAQRHMTWPPKGSEQHIQVLLPDPAIWEMTDSSGFSTQNHVAGFPFLSIYPGRAADLPHSSCFHILAS